MNMLKAVLALKWSDIGGVCLNYFILPVFFNNLGTYQACLLNPIKAN